MFIKNGIKYTALLFKNLVSASQSHLFHMMDEILFGLICCVSDH